MHRPVGPRFRRICDGQCASPWNRVPCPASRMPSSFPETNGSTLAAKTGWPLQQRLPSRPGSGLAIPSMAVSFPPIRPSKFRPRAVGRPRVIWQPRKKTFITAVLACCLRCMESAISPLIRSRHYAAMDSRGFRLPAGEGGGFVFGRTTPGVAGGSEDADRPAGVVGDGRTAGGLFSDAALARPAGGSPFTSIRLRNHKSRATIGRLCLFKVGNESRWMGNGRCFDAKD